jgi:hypothetical protein
MRRYLRIWWSTDWARSVVLPYSTNGRHCAREGCGQQNLECCHRSLPQAGLRRLRSLSCPPTKIHLGSAGLASSVHLPSVVADPLTLAPGCRLVGDSAQNGQSWSREPGSDFFKQCPSTFHFGFTD